MYIGNKRTSPATCMVAGRLSLKCRISSCKDTNYQCKRQKKRYILQLFVKAYRHFALGVVTCRPFGVSGIQGCGAVVVPTVTVAPLMPYLFKSTFRYPVSVAYVWPALFQVIEPCPYWVCVRVAGQARVVSWFSFLACPHKAHSGQFVLVKPFHRSVYCAFDAFVGVRLAHQYVHEHGAFARAERR